MFDMHFGDLKIGSHQEQVQLELASLKINPFIRYP